MKLSVVKKSFLLCCAILLSAHSFAQPNENSPALDIWFAEPPAQLFESKPLPNPSPNMRIPAHKMRAKVWESEAFPVGNGRMGAMVFGGIAQERIQLNEDTIWAGSNDARKLKNNAKQAIVQSRALIWQGDYQGAEKVLQKDLLGERGSASSYQTLGDLLFNFTGIDESKVSNYRRELDLSTAIATTQFDYDGIHYQRQVFVSAPDNVVVIHLTTSKAAALSFDVSLMREYSQINAQSNRLIMTGQAQHQGQ